jgi:hypothetical protein
LGFYRIDRSCHWYIMHAFTIQLSADDDGFASIKPGILESHAPGKP